MILISLSLYKKILPPLETPTIPTRNIILEYNFLGGSLDGHKYYTNDQLSEKCFGIHKARALRNFNKIYYLLFYYKGLLNCSALVVFSCKVFYKPKISILVDWPQIPPKHFLTSHFYCIPWCTGFHDSKVVFWNVEVGNLLWYIYVCPPINPPSKPL